MRSPTNTNTRKPPVNEQPLTPEQLEDQDVAASMVDALEDILRWERASERTIRVTAVIEPGPDTN